MAVIDPPSAREVGGRVQAEDDPYNVTPVRTLRLGIEQPQIESGMLPIVLGRLVAARRFVEEGELWHADEQNRWFCGLVGLSVKSDRC